MALRPARVSEVRSPLPSAVSAVSKRARSDGTRATTATAASSSAVTPASARPRPRAPTSQVTPTASTAATDGVDLSAQYIVDHDLAPVLSLSFGRCEPWMGAAERDFYRNLWAQAAAQGITVVVATGEDAAQARERAQQAVSKVRPEKA